MVSRKNCSASVQLPWLKSLSQKMAKASMILATAFGYSYSALCDSTWYLQESPKQILLSTKDYTTYTKLSEKNLRVNLTDFEPLFDSLTYLLPKQIVPSCDTNKAWTILVRARIKKSNQIDAVLDKSDGRFFDSTTEFVSPEPGAPKTRYSLALGLLDTSKKLTGLFHRPLNQNSGPVTGFYGTAILLDTLENQTTGQKTPRIAFFSFQGPSDSSEILKRFADGSKTWLATAAPRREVRIQLFKLAFDILKPAEPVRIESHSTLHKSKTNSIVGRIQGEKVLIQGLPMPERAGDKERNLFDVRDMFGRSMMPLVLENGKWVWQGQGRQGQRAPGGVYFIVQGHKVMGRFLYNP